ncbi:MAG: spermidine synthase [Methanosarcinales archaeon]
MKVKIIYLVIAITLFTTGAASMIYEVTLLREFTILLGSSFYSGSIVLAGVMMGLAIGSYNIGKLSDKIKNPLFLLFSIEIAIALIAIFLIPFARALSISERWLLTDAIIYGFGYFGITVTSEHILFLYAFCILLPPMILMGGELPLAIKILSKSTDSIGGISGYTYATDTIGGIVGSLSAGLFLIPRIGDIASVHLGGLLNLIGAMTIALYIVSLYKEKKNIASTFSFKYTTIPSFKIIFIAIIIISLSALIFGYYKAESLEYTTLRDLYSGQPILYSAQSKYQSITVIDHDILGHTLFLNGKEQISEGDDEPYSEALILPAVITALSANNSKPLNILIIGGGDLGGVEVLTRFSDHQISNITLVDLDSSVLEVSKKYLTKVNNYSWKDPRYHYIARDGYKYVKSAIKDNKTYDVVILDLPDPNDDILAVFYSLEFYNMVYKIIKENGVLCTQATQADWVLGSDSYVIIANTLKASKFPIVRMYHQYIPSFGGWGFAIASKKIDPLDISKESINNILREMDAPTHTYDAEIHYALFALPPWLGQNIKEADQINTLDKPVILQ